MPNSFEVGRETRISSLLCGCCLAACVASSQLERHDRDPRPEPAAEYIARAFDRYPIVALSELHGNPESKDLLLIHLLDARFPGETHVVSVIDVGTTESSIALRLQSWPSPSAAAIRGTWLGQLDVSQVGWQFSRGHVEEDVDAVAFLSPSPLIFEPAPSISDSLPHHDEMKRRHLLAEATLAFRGARIRFDPSVPSWTSGSIAPLSEVLSELRRNPDLQVVIKGFADGNEPNPMQLGLQRAELVGDWLAARGVAGKRMRPLGCGATRPLWSDEAEEHRAANRRVEIVRHTATAACQPPSSF